MVKMSDEFMNEYSNRLRKGQIVFTQKYKEIRDARQVYKQIMPEHNEEQASFQGNRVGNDPSQSRETLYSHYIMPHFTAIAEKIIQDMSTTNFRFEWEGNNKEGALISKSFSKELLKIYTLQNVKNQVLAGLWHAIISGTFVGQTFTEKKIEERIFPDGTKEKIDIGRIIGLKIYDPLTVIVDPNASPHDVTNTADWCIVTIGTFSPEHVKNHWGVDVSGDAKTVDAGKLVDALKKGNELEAGTDKIEEVVVREYYTRDGYRYVIVNDCHLASKKPNSNCICGRIPINFAPIFFDPGSPFGSTLFHMLEPSIVIMSAAINQISDTNALNNKMPFFALKDVFPTSGMSLNDFNRNEIVELDPSSLLMTGNIRDMDVNKLITKFNFPDVSQSALIMLEKAEQMIWILTGLSPETLGGIQTKQIRNSDVAQMINQSSLRNSSKIVVNLETGFFNPTTKDIAQIFEIYFDDFNFSDNTLTKEMLKELKNVRVVNGSYLPGDQMERFQKLSLIKQLAASQPMAYEHRVIEKDVLDAIGIGDPEIYLKSMEEMLEDVEWQRITEIYAQLGPEGFQQYLNEKMQAMQANINQQGA